MVRGAALILGLAAAPAAAQDQCRLALQLGFDVSASVDEAEYLQQTAGIASALIAPEIVEAFLNGPGPVALSIFEWSGRFQQDVIIDWTLITSEADLTRIAERVARETRGPQDFPTAIGYALGFAATRFQEAPPCLFQTLDLSGDGQNNDGFPPASAYEHFPFDEITVNGLAIGGASNDIAEYFEREVIRGPGAFVEFARGHDEFAAALRRKLERELRVMILGGLALPTGQLPLPM
ncbi:DUF1194 domain-containing protein [Roseicyclus persicicus]|uniref:DUF1194 domain-containing protein n=1 Tax=Roseicyclus persicicus TaxID=2650661 RepID=A0A7X6JWA4_9RHOB|nr:DUF1194 domain-containing protein [Roseibacterium persicicum]NKX43500.1 DUF1194 domain-containing protein [Roseibacterium persicicum]